MVVRVLLKVKSGTMLEKFISAMVLVPKNLVLQEPGSPALTVQPLALKLLRLQQQRVRPLIGIQTQVRALTL